MTFANERSMMSDDEEAGVRLDQDTVTSGLLLPALETRTFGASTERLRARISFL